MKAKLLLLISYMFILCLVMTSVVKAQDSAVIYVSPSSKTIPEEDIGTTFQLNISVSDVTDLWAWNVRVTWDASVLTCTKAEEGQFLKDIGTTLFPSPAILPGDIPQLSCGLMIPGGATGTGTLATLTFEATAAGTTFIILNETRLVDWAGGAKNEIPHTVNNGTLTVIPEFPASMILPLFITITTIIVIMAKIVWSRRRQGYIDV